MKQAHQTLWFTRIGLFERMLATDLARVKHVLIEIVGILLAVFIIAGHLGIRWNGSPSLPIGLYKQSDGSSVLVEFCPSPDIGAFAAGRGYRDPGNCPDGATPLMKPVIARAGDRVELSASGVAVNGRLLPNTAPRRADTQGRPLQPFPFGSYVVAGGTVWVASTYSPRSFDSRYFGPIVESSIRAHLRPLITE